MLVNKREVFLKSLLSLKLVFFIWLPLGILVFLGVEFLFYYTEHGSYEAAMEAYREPSPTRYRVGGRNLGQWSSYQLALILLSCVGVFITLGFIISLLKLKNILTGSLQANQILPLTPLSLNGKPSGVLSVHGKTGRNREASPYTEVYLDDVYLSGLMGSEGLDLTLPEGNYKLSLRLAAFQDLNKAKDMRATLTGPMQEPISEELADVKCRYRTDLDIMVKGRQPQKIHFKTFDRLPNKEEKETQGLAPVKHLLAWFG